MKSVQKEKKQHPQIRDDKKTSILRDESDSSNDQIIQNICNEDTHSVL